MSKIHVIIPVYNAKKFLREAVDSVLNQPYKGIDIVLVNDGSTDGSAQLCDEIAANEERVSVIHQENGGVSRARNAGIAYAIQMGAKEDYIGFLDADDMWIPNAITPEWAKKMLQYANTEMYLFCSTFCNENVTRFTSTTMHKEAVCDGGNASIWNLPFHFCANLYSAELLNKWNIRFVDGLKYAEDKMFVTQCVFMSTKIHYISKMLHIHRANENSAMSRVSSIEPIKYYLPIINGWIQSDDFLNSYESISGKHICAGYVLAGIYFMDMAADHYKRWGKRSKIEKVFCEHPYYHLFEQMRPQDVSAQQYKNHNLLLEHPLLFKWKYNLIGVLEYILRSILRLPPLQKWWMKRKCPMTQMPTND